MTFRRSEELQITGAVEIPGGARTASSRRAANTRISRCLRRQRRDDEPAWHEERPMVIIDPKSTLMRQHPKRPRHSVPNWPHHVTGDEMVAAMDRVGVDGAIWERRHDYHPRGLQMRAHGVLGD